MLKKVLVWGGIAFVVFFVAFRPSAAASVISTLGDIAVSVMQGITDFFSSLVT